LEGSGDGLLQSYIPEFSWIDWGRTTTDLNQDAGNLAKIQTRNLLNTVIDKKDNSSKQAQ
jgi:hypothetical protein